MALSNPCAFSPNARHARSLAGFYAGHFLPGQRIVDIGSGQGHFLDAARERGIHTVGLDRDQALVAAARERGYEAFDIDVGEIGTLQQAFDGALAAHLIEHLQPDQVEALLADVASAVEPGARFLIATPNFRDIRVATEWFWFDPTHVRPYPAPAVEQLIDEDEWTLEASGFEPTYLSRDTLRVMPNRLRFGRDYGRPGCWYRLRRI